MSKERIKFRGQKFTVRYPESIGGTVIVQGSVDLESDNADALLAEVRRKVERRKMRQEQHER